ncbi:SAM-dependent methyltransferase [Saccharothrix ecbatanensis]|uniref:SAM-dependent methyltransferase n=1 Tax=Saccharothrix ecbatanensis TaxID=1105145 RepID=A0A7W9LZR7_9PSEU|nr:class I SAM-dependent methyltransferase [Saccharothrix ecbatanensis]MBB5802195.1 SAM-dependent methyltransferase [Saccharothrix ecbatanensis]
MAGEYSKRQKIDQYFDFESIYRGDVPDLFNFVPWDIHGPQPVVVEIERAGGFHGDVLDAGCGRGENAIFLAGNGHRTTGIDSAPTAIEQARQRAAERGVAVAFEVADACVLPGYDASFDVVLDSGLYHGLSAGRQRRDYTTALHRATRPGARLHMLCASDATPKEMPVPFRISEDDLRKTLPATGWAITRLDAGLITGVMPKAALEYFRLDLEPDENGHIHTPAWIVEAERV